MRSDFLDELELAGGWDRVDRQAFAWRFRRARVALAFARPEDQVSPGEVSVSQVDAAQWQA